MTSDQSQEMDYFSKEQNEHDCLSEYSFIDANSGVIDAWYLKLNGTE